MQKINIKDTDLSTTFSKEHSTPFVNVGLSACLAGHEVRYNGGHTRSNLCVDVLSNYLNFKTFCPEVAAGFNTPRPTMRLIGDIDNPKLVFTEVNKRNIKSHETDQGISELKDLSPQLRRGFEDKLASFSDLDGYIVMKNSPSCGLERVKVYQDNGYAHAQKSAGLFTKALQEKYPLMPIEEEGRLNDDALFDNFLVRVFASYNFRHEVLQEPSLHKLITFHSTYKYVLLAHNQERYRFLGRLLALKKEVTLEELVNTYQREFMRALQKPAKRGSHTNTLLHILGYLKKWVPASVRNHIAQEIHKYNDGIIPLNTPITLLNHHLQQNHSANIINAKRYLSPYPETLNPITRHCR